MAKVESLELKVYSQFKKLIVPAMAEVKYTSYLLL